MKKNFRSITVSLTSIIISTCIWMPNLACAAEHETGYRKIHSSAFGVDVSVKNDVQLTEDFLDNLLLGIPAADRENFRIEEIGGNDLHNQAINIPENHLGEGLLAAAAGYFYTKVITNNSYKTNQTFLISVAKGMTTTLGSSVTVSDNISISGSVESNYLNFVKAEVRAAYGDSFSHTVSTEYRFTGPPENSSHNSRSYYIAILNDVGYYKVWKHKNNKRTVKFRAPRHYVIYSVDGSY